jgi:hypothetical protein
MVLRGTFAAAPSKLMELFGRYPYFDFDRVCKVQHNKCELLLSQEDFVNVTGKLTLADGGANDSVER